jgi:Trypsin-like peptidase domain
MSNQRLFFVNSCFFVCNAVFTAICTAQTVVPIVGYTSPTNVFFEGEAVGDGAGIVRLVTSTGHRCSGQWRYTSAVRGIAEANCSDGRQMKVEFYAQDPLTGTSISKGRTSLGEDVVAYAGANATRFMAARPEKPKQKTVSTGTAFLINERGHMITNHHVVPGCDNVSVLYGDKNLKASVLGVNSKYDLALLRIQVQTPNFATMTKDGLHNPRPSAS